MTERRVRALRLTAPEEALLQRGRILLEDALRTATLPSASGGRLVLVRRLDLGRFTADVPSSALSLQVEQLARAVIASAVSAEHPQAPQARAVFFDDPIHARVALATRLIRGPAPVAWFWPLAVTAWHPTQTRPQALRALLLDTLRLPPGPVAAAALLAALQERGVMASVLDALRPEDGDTLLAASGWSAPPRPAPSRTGLHAEAPPVRDALRPEDGDTLLAASGRSAPPLPAPSRAGPPAAAPPPLPRSLLPCLPHLRTWGPQDARAVWVAAVSALTDAPGRARDPRHVPRTARALAEALHVPQRTPAPAHTVPDHALLTEPPEPARVDPLPTSARPSPVHPPSSHPPPPGGAPWPTEAPASSPRARPQEEPTPARPSTRPPRRSAEAPSPRPRRPRSASDATPGLLLDGEPRPTALGGLFFLIPALRALGLPAHLETHPDAIDAALPRQILRAAALRAEADPADPCLAPLALPEGVDISTEAEAWVDRVEALLQAGCERSLQAVVRRPALCAVGRIHVDVFLALAGVDVNVRRAGLDLDPGWVPWLGWIIAYHYLDAESLHALVPDPC
ncbi:MAG: hypothetical protein H6739_35325 [Alphaproteobacteria bacterium]|nr:hypothetical protein [Alphaproteobacteria bacterium]